MIVFVICVIFYVQGDPVPCERCAGNGTLSFEFFKSLLISAKLLKF